MARATFLTVSAPGLDPAETFPRRYDRFELLEKIGEGGMAEVFKARLPGVAGFEKILVIKRILPHLARNERFVKMFVNEAQIAARLLHHNIVQVSELGQTDSGELYIAMEYVPGLDLRGILRNAARRLIRIPVWFTTHSLAQICGGLSHAHELTDSQGNITMVIHRDVTPSNVFISSTGDVKLADFGIAKAVGQVSETRSGQLKGKISYMSPEQLHGETLDPRADVFSAGVVLWECLTQRRLFGGRPDFETMLAICEGEREPPSKYNPKIPPSLDQATLQALEPDRNLRMASARLFQERLLQVMPEIRPALLPGDLRHVMDVLSGKTEPHPEFGADLPGEKQRRSASEPQASSNVSASSGAEPARKKAAPAPPRPAPAAPVSSTSQRPSARAKSSVSHAPLIEDMNFQSSGAKQHNIQGHYNGPFPFFIRFRNKQINGPLAYDEMLHASDPRRSEVSAISHDARTWTEIKDFARSAGLDFLAPENRSLTKVVMVARLEERSLAHVFSRLARAKASGRLLLMQSQTNTSTSRREIDIINGVPCFVFSDHKEFQTPALLVRRDIISDSLVPELIHLALREQTHLAAIMQKKAGVDLARHRSVLMRDRLTELFKWRKGKIAFSENTNPREEKPIANSLLNLLFDGVHRGWSEDELMEQLRPHLDRKWSASPHFDEALSLMELKDGQKNAAQRLIDKRSCHQIMKKFPTDTMVTLIMLYLLTEMNLLVER
jgi:serine/threonine protein kinase